MWFASLIYRKRTPGKSSCTGGSTSTRYDERSPDNSLIYCCRNQGPISILDVLQSTHRLAIEIVLLVHTLLVHTRPEQALAPRFLVTRSSARVLKTLSANVQRWTCSAESHSRPKLTRKSRVLPARFFPEPRPVHYARRRETVSK